MSRHGVAKPPESASWSDSAAKAAGWEYVSVYSGLEEAGVEDHDTRHQIALVGADLVNQGTSYEDLRASDPDGARLVLEAAVTLPARVGRVVKKSPERMARDRRDRQRRKQEADECEAKADTPKNTRTPTSSTSGNTSLIP